MAAAYLPWSADHPEHAENRDCRIGAELLSIEPWNTGTDGTAGCEDMPRKSIDRKLTDDPVQQKRGQLRPFPAFRRGRVRAEPDIGSRTGPLRVLRAAP